MFQLHLRLHLKLTRELKFILKLTLELAIKRTLKFELTFQHQRQLQHRYAGLTKSGYCSNFLLRQVLRFLRLELELIQLRLLRQNCFLA